MKSFICERYSPTDANSKSKQYRKQGNRNFELSKNINISNSIRIYRIDNAVCEYINAVKAAISHEEYASAAKNIAVSQILKGTLLIDTLKHQLLPLRLERYSNDIRTVTECFQQAYYYASEGISYIPCFTSSTLRDDWICSVVKPLYTFMELLHSNIKIIFDHEAGLTLWSGLRDGCRSLDMTDEAKQKLAPTVALCAASRAQACFSDAMLVKDDWKLCASRLDEACDSVFDSKCCMIQAKQSPLPVLLDLDDCIKFEQVRHKSMMRRNEANALYEKELKSKEFWDFSVSWVIADMLKEASLLANGICIESEARSITLLGKFYIDILRLEELSHRTLMSAVSLFQSLQPQIKFDDPEFKICREYIQAYQERKEKSDSTKKNKERAEMREYFKEELAKLKSESTNNNDVEKFVAYILKTHPPRHVNAENPFLKLNDCNNKKRPLMEVMRMYHPDKLANAVKDSDEVEAVRWIFLCEEIQVILNSMYCFMKMNGVDG